MRPRDHRKTLRAVGAGMTLAAATLVLPQSAIAQACIGSPAMSGQFALGGMLLTSDGQTGYGAEARANPAGPLAISASIGVIDVDGADDDIFTASAGAAWELAREGVSLCPVVGVEYRNLGTSFLGADVDATVIGIPLGFAAGTRLGSGNVRFIPSAEAGLLVQRFSFSGTAGGVTGSSTDTETDAYLRAGATAVTGRFYGRAALERIFQDNAENLFRFSIGVLF